MTPLCLREELVSTAIIILLIEVLFYLNVMPMSSPMRQAYLLCQKVDSAQVLFEKCSEEESDERVRTGRDGCQGCDNFDVNGVRSSRSSLQSRRRYYLLSPPSLFSNLLAYSVGSIGRRTACRSDGMSVGGGAKIE